VELHDNGHDDEDGHKVDQVLQLGKEEREKTKDDQDKGIK
jgi:hypothetical protein